MSSSSDHWFIETSADFKSFVDRQLSTGKPTITLDFEADSMHRYGESLCLIQFSDGDDEGLIDPLAIDDMTPLLDLMNEKTVWMHGADYDIQLLKQTFGEVPAGILDTQTAARFLGYTRFGYAAMVEEMFGVKLSKSSQRDDWAIRPLTQKMQDYALNDVRYMLPMAERLACRLKDEERYDWFLQTCEADRLRGENREGPGPDDIWRIKGSGRLDPKGLVFLRALWHWRDEQAKNWDRPSFMVARNQDLIDWSQDLADGKKVNPRPKWREKRKKAFFEAIREAQAIDPSNYPKKAKRMRRARDPEFDAVVDRLIAARNKISSRLEIEASFIISRGVIEALAHRETLPEVQLLPWQEMLLAKDLPEAYGATR